MQYAVDHEQCAEEDHEQCAAVGDRVIRADGQVGIIEGWHDGAVIVYWGTVYGERFTSIEVLGSDTGVTLCRPR